MKVLPISISLLIAFQLAAPTHSQGVGVGKQFNINCGGPAVGRFIAEKNGWIQGSTSVNPGDPSIIISGAEPRNAPALSTHRWSKQKWGYAIPVANAGEYECSLHFAETSPFFFRKGKRVFDVSVLGKTVKRIDVFREAGGAYKSLVKTFRGLFISDVLYIQLTPISGDPILSAITCESVNSVNLVTNPPSPRPGSQAVVLVGSNPDFSVTSCTSTSLNLRVTELSDVHVGGFIWKTPRNYREVCSSCNNVARKISSIVSRVPCGTRFCVTVETKLAKISDLFSSEAMKQFALVGKGDKVVERAFGCGTSTRNSSKNEVGRQVSSVPTTCTAWPRIKSGDGRCAYSNCIVGKDGNPLDCLFCKAKVGRTDFVHKGRKQSTKRESCNNGCGSKSFNVPDRIPSIFDFRESCCIHDHCYASSFKKQECDLAFLRDTLSSCADEISDIVYYIPLKLGRLSAASVLRCPLAATLYYLGVAIGGGKAHQDATNQRVKHEMSGTCLARCPTTQKSGGQGTTTLPVDLKQKSGVFKVTYNMYFIRDRLDVIYEGKTLFTTGGLVGGRDTVSISYSGTTTVVQVKITAPTSGTRWDVSVECPALSRTS